MAELGRRDSLEYAVAALMGSARALSAEFLRKGRHSPWRDVARITAPSLVIYGQHDRLVDPRAAGRAAHVFTDARIVVLPRTGHVAQMEHPGAGGGRDRHPAGNSRWLPPVDAGTGGGREYPARSVLKNRSLEQTVSLPPLVEPAAELTVDEVRRYSRHLIIPDVGMTGQKRLKNAKVLVVGAGGLGSPALLYLAAAGVGTLGIVDFDVVDESNLQRQIIHGQSDVGRPKAESARDSILEINPLVNVVAARGPARLRTTSWRSSPSTT